MLAISAPTLPPFRPPWWARGGHTQTIAAGVLPCRAPAVGGMARELELEDGDRVVLLHRPMPGSTRVVYLFHGLGGDSDSGCVRRAAAAFPDCHLIALNHRGCGLGKGMAQRPYHSGSAADLAAVVEWGRARHPDARHIAIGFSLSGNALLLGLARGAGPDAAIAVNPPIDLAACSVAISTGRNRVYDVHFVNACRRDPRARGYGLRPWHRLRDVDELYTAPAAGFADAADYYARCSASPHLRAIDQPTVILTAADDPFVPIAMFDGVPDSIHLHVERRGGHVGYLPHHGDWLGPALAAFAGALG
ncbi:MAG: alpha/beta fold hydrolase [Planctomycetota bacterium]